MKKKAVEKIRAEETSMKVVWNKGVSLFRTGVVGGGPTVIGGRNNSEKRKDQSLMTSVLMRNKSNSCYIASVLNLLKPRDLVI